MTGQAELRAPPPPWPCEHQAAVMLSTGGVGGHTGIYFTEDGGSLALLHLAFHLDLRCERPTVGEAPGWVVPAVPAARLGIVAALCENLAEEHQDGQIGYGFAFRAATISPANRIVIDQTEAGLTCSTLVMLVFRQAKIELLDIPTWQAVIDPARLAEDRAAQQELVGFLEGRLGRRAALKNKTKEQTAEIVLLRAHIQKMRAEMAGMRGARFRAEEVAAASGLGNFPVPFAQVAPEGARLLAVVKQAGG